MASANVQVIPYVSNLIGKHTNLIGKHIGGKHVYSSSSTSLQSSCGQIEKSERNMLIHDSSSLTKYRAFFE